MSVFLLSCTNEELPEKYENVNLKQAKKDLSLTKFSNVNIAKNVKVNWEIINETKKNDFTISEVAASEKQVSTLQSDYFKDHLKYQLVTVESENQTQSYFLEVFTNENSVVYPETITKLNDFLGTLNVFSLKGENLGSISIIHGIARNISDNDSLSVLSNVINSFANSRITSKIPLCTENYAQITEQITYRFNVVTVRGNVEAVYYMGSTTNYTSTILAYPCSGSGDRDVVILQRIAQYTHGGSGGGIAVPTPLPPDVPILDIKKFLSCLKTTATANLTVFTEKTNLINGSVGHTFISISQGNNVMTYGFYPENGYDKSLSGKGIMGENGGHAYDISANIGQISPLQLQEIIALSQKYQSSWYDLGTNNCSDFTTDVLSILGFRSDNLMNTPGTVSNMLEKLPNHTSKLNYAPKTKRTCL